MSPDARREAREAVSSDPVTVRVEHNATRRAVHTAHQGTWFACETLDDARPIEYLCAPRPRRRELIVHDSCRRRLRLGPHQNISGKTWAQPSSLPVMTSSNRAAACPMRHGGGAARALRRSSVLVLRK